MSRVVRKPDFCIYENKDADQLRGNREADQRLCFRYTDSTIPLLPESEISSLYPSPMAAQPGLCRTWSETRRPVFSQRGSYNLHIPINSSFLLKKKSGVQWGQFSIARIKIMCRSVLLEWRTFLVLILWTYKFSNIITQVLFPLEGQSTGIQYGWQIIHCVLYVYPALPQIKPYFVRV